MAIGNVATAGVSNSNSYGTGVSAEINDVLSAMGLGSGNRTTPSSNDSINNQKALADLADKFLGGKKNYVDITA